MEVEGVDIVSVGLGWVGLLVMCCRKVEGRDLKWLLWMKIRWEGFQTYLYLRSLFLEMWWWNG